MSAIAGVISLSQSGNPIKESVFQILNRLSHRGRQDEGYICIHGNYVSRFSGPGTHSSVHQRLQLPDIHQAPGDSWFSMGYKLGRIYSDFHPKAHQPYCNDNESIWAVLDGEIFNAGELAKEIRNQGLEMETDDQIEVLVKGYQLWHERILSKLEGSFAFVLYDRNEDKLFGARDPFGIKPLYYCHEENVFAFGSELKSLFGLPFVSKKVSKSAVYDYLILGQSETQVQYIFRGLSELMPGTAFSLLLPKGNIKVWSYFQLSTDSKIDRYSRNKVSTLSHRLRKSLAINVSSHLTPGYPTAYRFAGDIENMVFPFLLKESIREMKVSERLDPSKIYSALYSASEDNPEELEYLDQISTELGVELHRATCTFKDFTENLLKVGYMQDIPFSSLEVFGQYKLLEKAKELGIKVLIEPTGGAQLFSGSDLHFTQFLEDILLKRQYSIFLDNLLNSSGSMGKKLGFLFNVSKKLLFKSTADDIKETIFRTNQEEFSYIKDGFKDRYSKNLENSIKKLPESLNQLLINEFNGPFVKETLRTTDRNAQMFDIEVRLPFVSDKAMAETMIKSSSVYKIRGGQTGNLLRRSMRGVFPEDLLNGNRNSVSVNHKESIWLKDAKEDLKQFVTSDLDDYIDSKRVKNDWDQFFEGNNPKKSEFLWRIISLGVWRHSFFN